jgi:hypothetical protein
MRDEIDQLQAFRAGTPDPDASAWARAEQAITEARQQARERRRTRWLPGHWSRPAWGTPLAAAAAIVLIAVASTTAGSLLTRSAAPRPGTSATPAGGAAAGLYSGVPPYYMAVASSSLTVVRATWTGATLARITTRTPVAAVAGAADGRTFVLDEQRQTGRDKVTWVGQPAFYLLRLTASGTEESLTRLAVPAIPDGTVVSGLALSPDGSKLAVNVDSPDRELHTRLMEIMTYTLATGASRSWTTTSGITNPDAPNGFTGSGVDGAQSISWTAGSTLAFGVRYTSNMSRVGVRLLDTAARGTDLMADSRPVIDQDARDFGVSVKAEPPYYFLSCATNAMISVDGSAVVCVYSTTNDAGITTMGFARYSTRTGKMNHVDGLVRFKGEAPTGLSLYWVNSTGNIAIGTSETAGGGRVGVMNGDTFTPLPGVGGFEAIAW